MTKSTITVESLLVRELDIRFIDARKFVTEAKLNLNIHGYPNSEQSMLLEAEAIKLFHKRSQEEQGMLRLLNCDFQAAKERSVEFGLPMEEIDPSNNSNSSDFSTSSMEDGESEEMTIAKGHSLCSPRRKNKRLFGRTRYSS